MFKGIDFYSDTVTRPTPAMRKAMVEAEVGDEQKGEDPTTRRLEDMAADLLGKSAALFMPSATMANEIAIRAHCERGEELIAAENCHLFTAEAGGPAVHAGVLARPIRVESGIFSAKDLQETFTWPRGSHYPLPRLVSVENTTNLGGGIAWPIDCLDAVLKAAHELGLKRHLDGARLFNAATKSRVPAKRLAEGFDSVTLCLSKGLGCPVGALLAFDKEDWEKIRRLKQLMGGALRQSGILASAGIYALQNHVERLAQDHANASRLAALLGELDAIEVECPPSTNMVFFRWKSATLTCEQFLERCAAEGVRFSHVGRDRIRAVTHLDIAAGDIERAFAVVRRVCLS